MIVSRILNLCDVFTCCEIGNCDLYYNLSWAGAHGQDHMSKTVTLRSDTIEHRVTGQGSELEEVVIIWSLWRLVGTYARCHDHFWEKLPHSSSHSSNLSSNPCPEMCGGAIARYACRDVMDQQALRPIPFKICCLSSFRVLWSAR